MTEYLVNGREIYLAMRNYASETEHGGVYPTFRDPSSKTGLFGSSNEVFEALMPQYLDDKRPAFNRRSAWCQSTPRDEGTQYRVGPGENDWCYVRGLTDGSPREWPLLATAFAPGTLHYVSDPERPGGVWKGAQTVIIRVDGHAEIIDTTKAGETYFIPRRDKPTANAFAKDGEWLAGEHVEVLYPLPPPARK